MINFKLKKPFNLCCCLKPKKKIEVVSAYSYQFLYKHFPKELKAFFIVPKKPKFSKKRPTLKELENFTLGKKNEEIKGYLLA